jgi:hypothetical protein
LRNIRHHGKLLWIQKMSEYEVEVAGIAIDAKRARVTLAPMLVPKRREHAVREAREAADGGLKRASADKNLNESVLSVSSHKGLHRRDAGLDLLLFHCKCLEPRLLLGTRCLKVALTLGHVCYPLLLQLGHTSLVLGLALTLSLEVRSLPLTQSLEVCGLRLGALQVSLRQLGRVRRLALGLLALQDDLLCAPTKGQPRLSDSAQPALRPGRAARESCSDCVHRSSAAASHSRRLVGYPFEGSPRFPSLTPTGVGL